MWEASPRSPSGKLSTPMTCRRLEESVCRTGSGHVDGPATARGLGNQASTPSPPTEPGVPVRPHLSTVGSRKYRLGWCFLRGAEMTQEAGVTPAAPESTELSHHSLCVFGRACPCAHPCTHLLAHLRTLVHAYPCAPVHTRAHPCSPAHAPVRSHTISLSSRPPRLSVPLLLGRTGAPSAPGHTCWSLTPSCEVLLPPGHPARGSGVYSLPCDRRHQPSLPPCGGGAGRRAGRFPDEGLVLCWPGVSGPIGCALLQGTPMALW